MRNKVLLTLFASVGTYGWQFEICHKVLNVAILQPEMEGTEKPWTIVPFNGFGSKMDFS